MTQTKENWNEELSYCFEGGEPDMETFKRLSNLISGLLAAQKAELREKIKGTEEVRESKFPIKSIRKDLNTWIEGYNQALQDVLDKLK